MTRPFRVAALAFAPAVLLAGPLLAQPSGGLLHKTFPRGEEVCYGRVYDTAHLARNARQRVSALYFFKSLTPDPLKEEAEQPRPEQVTRDRQADAPRFLSVLVRFKDKPDRIYKQQVECSHRGDTSFFCGAECDGGGFRVRQSNLGLTVEKERRVDGLQLGPTCEPDPSGETATLDMDSSPYRLEPMRMSACHSERDAAQPAFVGKGQPLRLRFAERDRVCHRRAYDAAHLAKHPQQKVVEIALQTEGRVEIEDDERSQVTRVPVTLAAKLRDGTVATRKATCTAHEFWYACSDGEDSFHLFQGGPRHVMVRDLNFRKASGGDNLLGKYLRLALEDDDRLFRLEEADNANCELLVR